MFGVLFFTLSLTLVCASDRRLVNQINNLREDLSYVSSEISSLFQHFDMLNKTIWSKVLRSSMKSGEDHALEKIGDLSDKGSLTEMSQHEMMTLIKGFQTENKLNRRLLERLEAAEKKITEKEKLLNAERMDMLDIKNRFDAEMKTQHSEFNNMVERTNRLNLQLSEEAKALKQSNSDLRKELDQLRMNYETIKDELSEFKTKFEFNYKAMQDEFLTKVQYQINYSAMKGKFSEMAKTAIVDFFKLHRSCIETKSSEVQEILLGKYMKVQASVYCDADTDGGGWIVIMRRKDLSVNFNTTWDDYKNGFGVVDGDFWMGNEVLHQLTKSKPMELRVDMEEKNGNKVFAKYSVFKVGSEADKYVLTVSGYSGTAVDGLDGRRRYRRSNGMKFSTFDQDNDPYSGNCAGRYGGGWWYNACYNALLTGTWSTGEMYMRWYDGEEWRDLKIAEMKIR